MKDKNIFITLDYELFFGLDSGTQEKSIIEPTNRLLEVLDKFQIKATFFVDSGYLIKLNKYRREFPLLDNDYNNIINQIKILHRNGHDIQLHIHPHWEDSYFNGDRWVIDTTRYKLHDFSPQEVEDIVYRYKKALVDIVGDKIFVYRAGGWCIQPFEYISNALKKHNIWLDSTVFVGGKNSSKTHFFDFSNAPNKTYWRFESNPLIEVRDGFFTEVPISSYRVSPFFYWKLAFLKKFGGSKHKSFGDGKSASSASRINLLRMLLFKSVSTVSIDGYKSSLLLKAFKSFLKVENFNYFVVIGHPKALTPYSLEQLENFIKNTNINFSTYSERFYK